MLGIVFVSSFNTAWCLDFQSSRTLSLAQTGRGGALLNDTITLNPSLLGFQPVSSVSGTYNWLNNAQTSGSDNRAFNVSVIDGKNEYVNAGLSYTRRPDLDFIHVGLAKRVSSFMSVGISAKRFTTSSNNAAAHGAQVSGIEGGASVSFAPPPDLTYGIPVQIGITADNLRNKSEYTPYVGPRQIGGGVKVNLNKLLMLYGDTVENFTPGMGAFPSYASGAEISLGNDFYARGGLMGFREKGWSTGLGWVGPKIGISYGYQNRHVQAERSFQHAVTCDIYM